MFGLQAAADAVAAAHVPAAAPGAVPAEGDPVQGRVGGAEGKPTARPGAADAGGGAAGKAPGAVLVEHHVLQDKAPLVGVGGVVDPHAAAVAEDAVGACTAREVRLRPGRALLDGAAAHQEVDGGVVR